MTVVLLVGILVAIALPIYDNYRNKIWSAQAVAEISAMSLRIHVYEQDARAYPADLGVVQLATFRRKNAFFEILRFCAASKKRPRPP